MESARYRCPFYKYRIFCSKLTCLLAFCCLVIIGDVLCRKVLIVCGFCVGVFMTQLLEREHRIRDGNKPLTNSNYSHAHDIHRSTVFPDVHCRHILYDKKLSLFSR